MTLFIWFLLTASNVAFAFACVRTALKLHDIKSELIAMKAIADKSNSQIRSDLAEITEVLNALVPSKMPASSVSGGSPNNWDKIKAAFKPQQEQAKRE